MRIAHASAAIERYVEAFNMRDFLNDDLLRHLQLFHFPAYTHVYFEEQEQHFFYFLVEGQVQCSHYLEDGRLAVIALSVPFTAIGDLEILSPNPVRSNVVATRDTTMLGIERSVVERYGADDPRFLRFLIDQLREKLYKKDDLHKSQILPVAKRLALYLLTEQRSSRSDEIELPEKEHLASLLGVTPRHLNRVLRALVESGSISPGYPRLRILDPLALEGEVMGQPEVAAR